MSVEPAPLIWNPTATKSAASVSTVPANLTTAARIARYASLADIVQRDLEGAANYRDFFRP